MPLPTPTPANAPLDEPAGPPEVVGRRGVGGGERAGGLRQRKKAATREALVREALALFSERGFEATTVDEIAARAGVSRRTLFRYFPSKEALAFPRFEGRLRRFEALLAGPSEGAFEALRRAILALARAYEGEREELVAQQRVVDASPALVARERALDLDWERAMSEALGARGLAQAEADVLAGASMGAVRATLRGWFEAGAPPDLAARGEAALGLLAPGFRLAKGRREGAP